MTSTGSPFSQVDSRVKYLKALGAATEFTFVANAALRSVMTANEIDDQIASSTSGTSGMLYRDMGKRVTVVNSNGLVAEVYTVVQKQNGADTEGVPVAFSTHIAVKTYSANTPGDVLVVRTG